MKQEFVTLPREVVEQAIEALFCTDSEEWSTAYENELKAVKKLRAALDQPKNHIEQHLGMVPAGWKLVPIEPTMSMQHAALIESRSHGPFSTGECNALPITHELGASAIVYRAMLDAAPQPPASKDTNWPKLEKLSRVGGGGTFGIGTSSKHVVDASQRAHDEHTRAGNLTHEQMVEEERKRRALWGGLWTVVGCDGRVNVYTHPQPQHEPLTDEQIDAIADAMPGGLEGFMKGWGWRQFARAIEAAHNIK